MKLIDEARHAYKMLSLQAAAAIGVLQTTYISLPDEIKALVPHEVISWATMALLALVFIGRLVKQDCVSGPAEDKQP